MHRDPATPDRTALKGTLAAAAAAALLLGGAGTLAYWSDSDTVDGTGISSGHLKLTNASCDPWTLDGGAAYTTQQLVPGDTLTEVCTYTVDAAGSHLAAIFDVTAPTFGTTNALTNELDVAAVYTVNGTTVSGTATPVADGDVIVATVTIDFDGPTATNASNDLAGFTSALDDITITATQSHSA